jgi:hypothetical protein
MVNWIKNTREGLKISKTRLADDLKIDLRTYTKKENNNSFTIEEFNQLVKYLGYELIIIKPNSITNL